MEESRLVRQAYDYYPGLVRLVYHHYAGASFTEKAAAALEAAGEQGRFWEMHGRFIGDDSYDIAGLLSAAEKSGMNLEDFTAAHLLSEAEALNLDIELFTAALESERLLEKVRLAKQEAIQSGIKYVSIFINGIEFTKHPAAFEDLRLVIDAELAESGALIDD